jgi:hypothetical protein
VKSKHSIRQLWRQLNFEEKSQFVDAFMLWDGVLGDSVGQIEKKLKK